MLVTLWLGAHTWSVWLQLCNTLRLYLYMFIFLFVGTRRRLIRWDVVVYVGTLRLSIFGYSWNEVGDSYDQRWRLSLQFQVWLSAAYSMVPVYNSWRFTLEMFDLAYEGSYSIQRTVVLLQLRLASTNLAEYLTNPAVDLGIGYSAQRL